MFDIGFWEIAIIGVVALLVVGPERLPALARTTGLYVGRMRRFVNQVKQDVEAELHAQELKDIVKKPEGIDDVYEMLEETKDELQKTTSELNDRIDDNDNDNDNDNGDPEEDKRADEDWTRQLNVPGAATEPGAADSPPTEESESDKSTNR